MMSGTILTTIIGNIGDIARERNDYKNFSKHFSIPGNSSEVRRKNKSKNRKANKNNISIPVPYLN